MYKSGDRTQPWGEPVQVVLTAGIHSIYKNTRHGLFVRKLVHHKTSWGSRLRLTTISLTRSVAAWYWMPSWNRQTKSWHEDYDIQFIQNKALGALNTLSNPVGKLHLSSLRQSPCQIWWWRLNSFRGIACETDTHTDAHRLGSVIFLKVCFANKNGAK